MLDGVLFFPVTPFTEAGEVDLDKLAEHVGKGVDAGPGGVFVACGTGEFHALETEEFADVVRTAVEVVAGPGAGLRRRRRIGRPGQDLRARRRGRPAPTASCCCRPTWSPCRRRVWSPTPARSPRPPTLPVIVYNRSNARYTEASAVEVGADPQRRRIQGRHRRRRPGRPDRARRHRRPGAVGQAVPVLQRSAHRRGLAAGLPRHRRHAVLVGHLRVRPRTGAGVLRRPRA